MDKNYSFYRGILNRIQAVDGEPGLLAATEVVQAVCDAGFQRNGFSMKSYPSSPHYYYKFAKPPKEGMFLLRAVKKTDMTTQDILIDTRIYPCFVMIEKQADWQDEPEEVVDTVELRINIGAEIFNWHINLQEHRTNKTQHLKEFMSALSYMEDIEDMHEKHNSTVQIGQLILKVNGNNYYHGNTEMEEPTDATEETQPEDNDTVQKLKPLFYNNEDNVIRFLKEIDSMPPNNITDLVNQWVKDKLISDYGNSRKGELWKILHDAKLYSRTIQNWNRRVF